MINPIFGV